MRATTDRWEVLLEVPRDVGDLGLHQPEDLAAAHFRRQLVTELGAEHAARVGPEAERQFREARAVHAGRPVLWSGFIMTATPAGAGVEPDTSQWPTDPAERDRYAELAATPDALLITLTIGVRELAVPEAPVSAAALVSRAVKARVRERGSVHLVRYGDVEAVAVVRTQDVPAEAVGAPALDGVLAADRAPAAAGAAPVAEHILAEVHLLFPDDDAVVTVTAATPNGGAVNDAVLLAGTLARGVRLRSADAATRTPAARAEAGPPAGAPTAQAEPATAASDTGPAGGTPSGTEQQPVPGERGEAGPIGGTPSGAAQQPAAGERGEAEPAGETPSGAAQQPAAGEPGGTGAAVPSQQPPSDAPAQAPQPGLQVVLPGGQVLPEGLALVGRRPSRTDELPAEHTVTLRDESVSRTHLALRVTGSAVTATDLHSTNGTLVRRGDGTVVALAPGEPTSLAAGDQVHLGTAVLRVVATP